jgi:O-antigen/teichoic acid export membrane protein/O-antigen ligase
MRSLLRTSLFSLRPSRYRQGLSQVLPSSHRNSLKVGSLSGIEVIDTQFRYQFEQRLRSSLLLYWRRSIFVSAFCILLIVVIVGSALGTTSSLLVVALLLVLGICLWALVQPGIALIAVFAGAGLPSFVWSLPGHAMRPIEPALLLCLFVVIVRRSSLYLRLPHLLALLFTAIAAISFIHVPQIATTANTVGADKRLYGVLLLLLALLCGTWLAPFIKNISFFLVSVLLFNLPLYVVALAQICGVPLPLFLEDSGVQAAVQASGRLWGPFDGAVTFALYLVNLFAVSLGCWCYGRDVRYRAMGFLMAVLAVAGMIGAGARGAMIAAGVMLCIALLIEQRYIILCGIVALIGILIYTVPGLVGGHFAHDVSSLNNRMFLWEVAISLIVAHPLLGIGLQQFPFYYKQLIVSQSSLLNPEGISVHNQWLELALESGILWLVVGACLLMSIMRVCWSVLRRARGEQRALLLAVMLACMGVFITGCFDVPLDKVEGAVFFFLLAGLALGIAERVLWSNERARGGAVSSLFPMTGCGVDVTQGGEGSGRSASSRRTGAGRAILLQAGAWALAVPLIFPATALLARALGPLRYGEYSALAPFLALFALLTCTGMDALIVRRLSGLPRAQWGNALSEAAGARLVLTLCSVGCAAIVVFLLPVSGEQRELLLLGSVSLLFSYSFNGLRAVFEHGFRAEERIGPVSLLELLNRLGTALLIIVAVLLRLPFLFLVGLILYSDLPFCLALMGIARRRFGMRVRLVPWRVVWRYVVESIPLSGYNLMTLLAGQADMLLLAVLANARAVGVYALASRVTDPLLALVLAYAGSWYPRFCQQYAVGAAHFARSYEDALRVLVLLMVPCALGMAMLAPLFVLLLGGAAFGGAVPIVQWLICAMAFTFCNQLAVRACTSAHRERGIAFVTLVALGVNVLLNVVLIPRWQGLGASVAACASECVGLCLLFWLLRSAIEVGKLLGMLLRVMLCNLPGLVLLLWHPSFSLLLLPLALLLTICCYCAVGVLSLRELAGLVVPGWGSERGSKLHTTSAAWPLAGEREADYEDVGNVEDVSKWPTVILPEIHL